MNRRAFLSVLAGVPLVGRLIPVPRGIIPMRHAGTAIVNDAPFDVWVKSEGFGYLDVETAKARGFLPAQVFLDGQPLPDCHTLNDIEGWADCWVKDSDGHFVLTEDRRSPVTERRYGLVTYIPNRNGKPGQWGCDL